MLGLLERLEPATPYDLKQLAALSTVNFWTVPHTQIYTECDRLADGGLLEEERESTGTAPAHLPAHAAGARGAAARGGPTPRASSTSCATWPSLKLFFGADPKPLAAEQLEAHRRRLADYEELLVGLDQAPEGWRLALELGIGHEREFLRFWSRLSLRAGRPGGARRSPDAPAGCSGNRSPAGRSRRDGARAVLGGDERAEALDHHDRLARVLRAGEIGRGRGGVGDGEPGRLQLEARGVGAPAPVVERRQPGEPDRDVDLSVAPGAPEAVGDQHRRRRAPT